MPQSEGGSGFGEKLRALRSRAGLSQEELAGRSGLAGRTIARLEQGHSRRPRPESARLLAEALQLRDAERADFMACASRRQAVPGRIVPHGGDASDGVAGQAAGIPRDSVPTARRIAPQLPFYGGRRCAGAVDSEAVSTGGVNGGFPSCAARVVMGVEPAHEQRDRHQKILTGDLGFSAAVAVPAQLAGGAAELGALARWLAGAGGAGGTVVVPRARRGGAADSHSGFAARDLRSGGDGSTPEDRLGAGADGVAVFRRVCQLPADVPDFAGRSAECGRLAELLAVAEGATAVPVVVVSGLPGVGKTSLAVHVAHAVRARFPDGQLYVQLAGASASPRAPGEVLGELLRAVGVAAGSIPGEAEARSVMLRAWLADRRVLVLADDAASAAQVRMLIPGTAGCAVMVTSRDRLAGLTAARLHLECLPPGEAVDMLGRIAGQQRVAADPAAAAALAAGCGYLPLAVRIAGARLAARPSWPVATLATAVADHRKRLDALSVADLGVRTALEVSYQALPSRARTAFRFLALAGPFDVAGWVTAVLLGSGQAGDVVDLLVDKSMLDAGEVDATGQPRYRLHDLLRDYAGERLAGDPPHERAAGLERLLHAWLQLSQGASQAMACNPYLPPVPSHQDRAVLPSHVAAQLTADPAVWFSTERLNLRHATAQACDSGYPALGLQLAAGQAAFHHSQARFDEAEQLWRMVSTAARNTSDTVAAAHAAFGLAATRALQGYHAEVSGVIGQCVTAFAQLGDQRALAWALYWQAACAAAVGRHPDALEYAQRGLEIARTNREPGAEIMLLRQAAFALSSIRGRAGEAIARAERALDLARQAGEPTHELDTLRMLAHVNNRTGHHSTAEHIARQGIDLAAEHNYIADRAYFWGALGDACHGLGRYQDAIDAFGHALPTFREHGLRRHEALCQLKLAESHLALGNTSQARPYLIQCQPTFSQLRMPEYLQRARKAM